jgi:hypothetical protein
MIYIDGVLCVRGHSSGQYVFRDGVKEGLQSLGIKWGATSSVSPSLSPNRSGRPSVSSCGPSCLTI